MCELFGLSSSRPLAGLETPLGKFRSRGGAAADNPDGWGMAWRGEAGFQLAKEPLPGCRSERFESLIEGLRSDLVIAHLRKAKFPPVNTLNNTHPFLRECCGRHWAFAHNGLVPDIVAMEAANSKRVCQPQGETDSEFAFCHLLSHVTQHIHELGADPDWLAVLGAVSELIAQRGKFNFLLSDGDYVIAYGHDRLHYLESSSGPDDVVLIATEPLNGHAAWAPFEPGELRIYRAGRLNRYSLLYLQKGVDGVLTVAPTGTAHNRPWRWAVQWLRRGSAITSQALAGWQHWLENSLPAALPLGAFLVIAGGASRNADRQR